MVAATDATMNDRLSYHAALPVRADPTASQLRSALPLALLLHAPAREYWNNSAPRQHAPQTSRRRRTIQARQGQNRRGETSLHEHHFCHAGARTDRRLKRPYTPRVNQIVFRGRTTHRSGCGSDSCPIVEDSGTKLCTTAAQPSLPGLRRRVQPNADCVFGDQT